MSVNRRQKLTIFATCNKKYRLAPEMLSRFLKFHLQPYTYAEFKMITTTIAEKRFKRSVEFGENVADAVWHEMRSGDVRDCIKVIRLCKDIDQIEVIMKALQAYSENNRPADLEEEELNYK